MDSCQNLLPEVIAKPQKLLLPGKHFKVVVLQSGSGNDITLHKSTHCRSFQIKDMLYIRLVSSLKSVAHHHYFDTLLFTPLDLINTVTTS